MSTSKIAELMGAAQSAQDAMLEHIGDYHARCIAGRWKGVEAVRQAAHDNLDALFDHLAAAHRVMDDGQSR